MLPRVLLFASDERTARLLTPLLSELEFEVEHCAEIFAAVERLTSRSYQAIIADWTEELETSFFLKTARELKTTKSVFILAIVAEKNVQAAFQVGVNGVLQKPLVLEQARNTLLSARERVTGTKLANKTELQTVLAPHKPTQSPPSSVQELLQAERFESAMARISRPEPCPVMFAGGALITSQHSKKPWAAALVAIFVLAIAGAIVGGRKFAYWPKHSAQGRLVTAMASVAPESATLASAPQPASVESPTQKSKPELKNSSPSPGQDRLRTVFPSSHAQKAKPQESDSTLLAEDDSAQQESPLDVAGVNRPLPDSLLTPVPAMTAREAPAKLSSGGSKWTGEPIALPEEISHALLLHQVTPSYPEQALRAGIHGAVVLHAWVARDGSIRDLKLMQGSLLLGRAAFEAVKQWRYRPYRLNGEIVEMQTSVTIDFRQP